MRIHLTHDDLSNSDYGRWFCDFILSNSQHQIKYLYEEDPHKSDIILIISRGDKYYSWLRYHPLVYKYSG
ncbi:MAG: hypothetical protein NZZ41_08125, partial [Candidatus Dojkabacteria bacterium]|nr:hypothetical protein [Candidatus Dojkabacteria bacterium]